MNTFCVAKMILAFLLLCTNRIQAQVTAIASGGNATGSGGTISYTVGQVAYITNNNKSGTVTQGVQQPFEIFVVTGIDEINGIRPVCSVYPNPASDFLLLKVEGYDISALSFQLYDVNSKILENKKVIGNKTIIPMESLVPATYFLIVIDNQKVVKTFKIIKNI